MALAATDPRRRTGRRTGVHARSSLRLLEDFQLRVGGKAVALPHSVERVLAFLGVSQEPVSRTRIAANLWPDVVDHRANGDLRSALWRLRRITGVLHEEDRRLTLTPDVDVDVLHMADLTDSLLDEACPAALKRVRDLVRAQDILPGWDEEWLIVERERFRLTRLRALERSAEALLAARDYVGALEAAAASIVTEPYRETAHRLVIQIHLEEGNNAEALRVYQSYRSLVTSELGIAPSPRMEELVAHMSVPARSSHRQ